VPSAAYPLSLRPREIFPQLLSTSVQAGVDVALNHLCGIVRKSERHHEKDIRRMPPFKSATVADGSAIRHSLGVIRKSRHVHRLQLDKTSLRGVGLSFRVLVDYFVVAANR
jgi:hypothetical protein